MIYRLKPSIEFSGILIIAKPSRDIVDPGRRIVLEGEPTFLEACYMLIRAKTLGRPPGFVLSNQFCLSAQLVTCGYSPIRTHQSLDCGRWMGSLSLPRVVLYSIYILKEGARAVYLLTWQHVPELHTWKEPSEGLEGRSVSISI